MTETTDFLTEHEELNTGAPTAEEAAAEARDDREWTLPDGTVVSKSEFVRHQFTVNNLARKAISEQFDIPYRTVYGATLNMTNDAEPTSRGRGGSSTKVAVLVSTNEAVQGTEEDGYTLNGEPVAEEVTMVERNAWIREQIEAGASRGDLAKALNVSYGVVYGASKDLGGQTKRHEVEHEGKMIPRNEYIRILHAEGKTNAEIAEQLEVEYSVVWSALKALRTEQEKFLSAVERLEKFEAHVVDAEAFKEALELLKAIDFKEAEADDETEATEDSAE